MQSFDIGRSKNLKEFIDTSFKLNSNSLIYKGKNRYRTEKYTYSQIHTLLKAAGIFYRDIGIKQQDKILVIGPNSSELATIILSGFYNNIVIVPADVRSSKELIERYYKLTKPKLVFSTRLRTSDVSKITKSYLIVEDFFDYLKEYKNIKSPRRKINIPQENLAEIVFTSGTTGTPKGVMLTHRNIVSNVNSLQELIPEMDDFESLSILPLSHMYEQIIGLLVPISAGGRVCYVKKVSSISIKKALDEWNITHLVVVPQVLKNLYKNIEREAEKVGKKKLLQTLNGICRYLPYPLRKIIFSKVQKELGGRIKFIATGGAKLDVDVGQKWENMGFKIMEGYGATEVTAGATGNKIDNRKLGSVGYPLPGVKIKVDKNNEVLIKGRGVSPGYYKNKEKTKEVFTKDGWYKSADMGKVVNGRLYLLGRDAFKIVLSSGENVYVEDLESKLNQEKEIWESCVTNLEIDGREKVHAVIIASEGFSKKQVEKAVERVNLRLEQHQQITSHSFWDEEDFPRTHTLKVDRKFIKRKTESQYKGEEISEDTFKLGTEEKDVLISIIAEISDKNIKDIGEETNIGADLSMDSIDRVELVALIEDEFSVFIDDYAINSRTKVNDLRALIDSASNELPKDKLLQLKYFKFPWSVIRNLTQKWLLFPLYSLFIKTKIEGLQYLQNVEAPVIFAYNHIGPLDSVTFLKSLSKYQLEKTANAAQENFWINKPKIIGSFLQLFGGAFPVSPDQASGVRAGLERIGKLLDNGVSVSIAPEGRMTRTGKMQKFKRGIGVVASEMKVPIFPIKIEGNYTDVFRVPRRAADRVPITFFLPRFKKAHIKVKIGKPLNLPGISYNLATEIVEDAIRKL